MPSNRSALLASLVTFQGRLWVGGLVAATLVPLSILAAALDWVAGRGPESGHYARVRREASVFDAWIGRLEAPAQRSGVPVSPGAPGPVRERTPARSGGASA